MSDWKPRPWSQRKCGNCYWWEKKRGVLMAPGPVEGVCARAPGVPIGIAVQGPKGPGMIQQSLRPDMRSDLKCHAHEDVNDPKFADDAPGTQKFDDPVLMPIAANAVN